MPFEIIRNDITKVKADAVVNTANPEPVIGAGVDSAIYKAAGEKKLLAERRKIGRMAPGEAKATPAFGLDAKYIIHTVGPAWQGGDAGEKETVAKCYSNSLTLAKDLGLESIAFPLISTGTLGFPKALALETAVSAISEFILENDMNVYLVVYNKEAFELSEKLMTGVKSYIEDSEVVVRDDGRYSERRRKAGHTIESMLPDLAENQSYFGKGSLPEDEGYDLEEDEIGSLWEEEGAPAPDMIAPLKEAGAPAPDMMPSPEGSKAPDDIDKFLKERSETFQQRLFRLIDQKGFDDIDVYKRANLDRKLFSKIKSNLNYTPSKRTAFALAVALRLNLDETVDFIRQAGLAFMPSSKFDRIISYCITHEIYDIYTINCILFEWDQPTLGA